MLSIQVLRHPVLHCGAVLLSTLVLGGCSQQPKSMKKTKAINCDNSVTVNKKSVKPDSVYLCDGDSLTWVKGSGTDSFSIDFHNKTPFSDNATKFDDHNANHPGQAQYGDLDVYKYSIVIKSGSETNTLDPQVVSGGNP